MIRLFGPTSQFEVGQSVEQTAGGVLMIIQSIIPRQGMRSLIRCRYYDKDSGMIHTKEFSEEELKAIDWVHQKKGMDDFPI